MIPYADTSFLFSYYASDANSARADAWRQRRQEPLFFTVLHRLELRNAFELAVFQGRISSKEVSELWEQIETDLRAGLLVETTVVLSNVFSAAETLSRLHTAETGARTLDIMHVAVARFLGALELVTFDLRQISLGNRIGIPIVVL